jgi:hypothetical protein
VEIDAVLRRVETFTVTRPRGTGQVTRDRMNKPPNTVHRTPLTLGDLILAVSSSSRNNYEAAAALADLFNTGRVRLRKTHHQKK